MDDLISRQAAIDALQDEINKLTPSSDETSGAIRCGVRLARNIIEDVPSVQPEPLRLHGENLEEELKRIKRELGAILPSAEKRTNKRTETHGVCLDTIDRQATLDWLKNEWNGMVTSLFDGIKALPSAQPELPEFAQKVEEYRKSAPSFVRNQLVWALYQTWKEYDGRLVHQRGKENG